MLSILWLIACGGAPAPSAAPEPVPAAAPEPEAPKRLEVTKDADISGLSEADTQAFLLELGDKVYQTGDGGIACITCHGPEGKGVPGAFPTLVGQQEWMGDCENHARIVIHGLNGPMTVDGIQYNGVMMPQPNLNDLQVAAVTSFVRNRWGNHYGFCRPEDAAAVR